MTRGYKSDIVNREIITHISITAANVNKTR